MGWAVCWLLALTGLVGVRAQAQAEVRGLAGDRGQAECHAESWSALLLAVEQWVCLVDGEYLSLPLGLCPDLALAES